MRLLPQRLLLTLLILSASTRASRASDFLSTTWHTEEGLPHSSVNSIIQTHDGYLWIGTFVGAVRFDGVRFVHYSTATMPQLGPGRVSKLFEDRDGVLWIGLESGRLVAWKNGEARIHLPNSTNQNDAIISMVQDREGTIWLQTSFGHFGRLTKDSVEFLANTGPLMMRSALGLLVDGAGRLWVGTKDGLRLWDKDKLTAPPEIAPLDKQQIDAMGVARDGGVWAFSNQRLWKIHDLKAEPSYPLPSNFDGFAVEIVEARDGRLWVASGFSGLYCRQTSGVWTDVSPEFRLRGGTKALCEDLEGNLWRGSFGGGLTRLRPRIFSSYELPEKESDRYADGLYADRKGNAWGLLNGRTLARIDDQTHALQTWEQPAVPQGLRTLFHDSRGTLWFGWGDGHIGRWRTNDFSVDIKASPESDFVNAFFEDAQSNIWVGFSQGAGVGVIPNGDPAKWHVIEGMNYPDVRAVAQSADGAMWFGTHYGGAFHLKDGHWTRYTTRDGLSSDYIRCIMTDSDGTVWLGSMYGLNRWRNGTITQIKTENGLWHNAISAMVEDNHGNFWLSSFGGVFRVSRQQLNEFADGKRTSFQCIGYNRNDGLSALESPGGFQPAGVKTLNGRIFFPTVDGIVSVDAEHIIENKSEPPVVLEEVLVDGKPASIDWKTPSAEIPAGQHRVEIRFTALSLTAPEKVRFQHKLEGLDSDWSQPDDRRTITYNILPYGHYTFHVTACNNDGVWNAKGAALTITVHPFIWQTWWFKIFLGAALAIGLIVAVRRREQRKARLRLEAIEQQHAIERERARIAQDIHDEVGASLTQITFLSERVQLAGTDTAEVEHWNQRVNTAARRTIQSLDEIVWAVSPKYDTLESLANYLSRFAQDHLDLAGVRCVLDVLTVLPPLPLTAEVRHNLLLATREALQNAVTHAAATEVHVGLELRDDALEIRITDNGRGFDPASIGDEGNGLPNMRKRLADIGGRTEITSKSGGGTTVKFIVPRDRLHARGIDSGKRVG